MTYFKPIADQVEETRVWATSPMPRIPTGFRMLDERMSGGIAWGELALFLARPSVGKTTFALNVISRNVLTPTVFFSLEMHARYVLPRLAAVHSDAPTSGIQASLERNVPAPSLDRVVEDFQRLAIVDVPAMSVRKMETAIEEVRQEWGEQPRLVVIDYLELIRGVASFEQQQTVDKLSWALKELARSEDCAVLCLHQVPRGEHNTGAQPLSLNSGRFGGEMAADYVVGAFRPCLEPGLSQAEYLTLRPKFMLQLLKNRGGSEIHPEGALHRLDPETLRIVEWEENSGRTSRWQETWEEDIDRF